MLTFVLALAPLIWLLSLIERKKSPFRGWNNLQERVQFERELDNWKHSTLVQFP